MKRWFQSKTVWLGILTLILSILTFIQGEEWISQYPQVVAIIGTVIGVLTIILRFFTHKSMELTVDLKNKLRK